VFAAVFFGSAMYVVAYRRYIHEALEGAREVSSPEREDARHARRRVAVRAACVNLPLTAFFLALVLSGGTKGGLVGIIAGGGLTFLVHARQIRRWEKGHAVEILREPRWRWRREHGRWGRGVMDAQDFYFVMNDGAVPSGSSDRVTATQA
jgi:hypothetical protein